jgi:hypothetical protein
MPVITKDQRIQIVATRWQLEAWKERADQEGLTLSAWLRSAADLFAARDVDLSVDRYDRERAAVASDDVRSHGPRDRASR